ncbi:MAG TPA: MopE-related protein, partial [Polyangium sp.]|nr:MopE-related protein [Polyangium sp.]
GQPSAEVCNGLDDDCNGQVDNGISPLSCGIGACAVTAPACVNGQAGTCTPGQPSAEVCNGLDDDCNGQIDNGITPLNCGIGVCAVTAPGCVNGQAGTCTPGQPSTELCNGFDDDCDGQLDEGCSCINGTNQSCYDGPTGTVGVGSCRVGSQMCTNGTWGACTGQILPGMESCNGVDDDCNGQIDEGIVVLNCGVGACAATAPGCVNGQPGTCTPGQPGNETCNGLDDDCNGQTDEGIMPLTCGLGACAATAPGCVNGQPGTCTPGQPGNETCNGIDDNCNGTIDENNPGGGSSCNTGNQGVCSAGTLTCSSGMLVCVQNTQPAPAENCGTTVDDDCDGQINEGCVCTPFATRSCYSGPGGTAGVGICRSGTQTCNSAGTAWGVCTGEVLPGVESCKNNLDDDCDNATNEGCAALNCQDFYVEDFNDGNAGSITGVYKVDWCNSYVATAANTPACMLPGQTTRTNATGGTNAFVGIWVNKATASCSAVRLSYDWYQFANAGAVVEYKQTTDTFASYSSCSASSGWTTAVPSTSMSTLQTCSSIVNINIPFGTSPGVYIKFKSTNAQNNAMWWDNIKLTLVGCDC